MGWLRRTVNLFRRSRLDDEIDEELRFHVAMRAAEFERDGQTPGDAQREALRRLGNPASLRDRTREADAWVHLESALQDVRLGLRLLRRAPLFTLAAATTLALGIGVNAATFGVLYGVLVQPLPYAEAGRLYLLHQASARTGAQTRVSPPDYQDWRGRSRAFEMAALAGTGFTFTGGGDAELVVGHLVAGDFFGLLGVSPIHGRTFAADELDRGDSQVLVLSHRLWQRRFGGDPSVVGSSVTVNGRPYTIVGVMPADFAFQGARYELWTPFPVLGGNPDNLPLSRTSRYLQVLGKLRPGVTPLAAAEDLQAVSATLAEDHPETHWDSTIALSPLKEAVVGAVRPGLQLLLVAVLLVLAMACANVTGLLLARYSVRAPEVLVRAALGASRMRIVRQFLTETLVLYGLGTSAGLLLAHWLLVALRGLDAVPVPRLEEVGLVAPVVLASCLISLGAALVFGALPAWQSTHVAAAAASARGTTTDRRHHRFRAAIVVSQMAVAVGLLGAAGLVGRSLANLQAVDPGFEPRDRFTFGVVLLPVSRFPTAEAQIAFSVRLTESMASQPGFGDVGFTTHLPLTGQDLENTFVVEGYEPPDSNAGPVAALRGVSPGYTAAMGIALRRGRPLATSDNEAGAPVALVNEAFVRRYLAEGDPVGRRLAPEDPEPRWRTIVGVVEDVRHRGLTNPAGPEVLVPYQQMEHGFLTAWGRGLSTVIHTQVPPAGAASQVRRVVRLLVPDMPVLAMKPMEALLDEAVARPRVWTLALGLFASVALMLAAVGVFGVLSFLVSQRSREIGIRMALGATPEAVFRRVLSQGARLVLLGGLLGLMGGTMLWRGMAAVLFEVSPADPLVMAAAALTLVLVASLATLVPARRATRVNPLDALRI